jgi:hypothetical protein
MANTSRAIAVAPGGYVQTHLNDQGWWTGAASNATKLVEGRMATQSTRLVADAWHTAWVLSRTNTSDSVPTPQPRALHKHKNQEKEPQLRHYHIAVADIAQWRAAVDRAAEADRAEPTFHSHHHA